MNPYPKKHLNLPLIKTLCEEKKLGRRQIAIACDAHYNTVCLWWWQTSAPNPVMAERLAALLGCAVSDLWRDESVEVV